jgi:protein-tyrosine phosphatase
LSQPKLATYRKLSTEELVGSLCPGEVGALKVKPDGTIMDGHHRLAMRVEVYWVPGPWPGRLGIVPRPRGGDWLADEVRSWRAAGLDVVTSLLTPEEAAELELQDEEAQSLREGLEFHAFPIPDRGVPRSRVDLTKLVRRLERALESGKNVAVHCRQGIGRSSMVVASLLVSAGEEPDEAFRRIEKARETSVPDTIEQREWVSQIATEAPL